MLYKFFLIKYELKKSSFKVFNNIVGKHKYYYKTSIIFVISNL